MMKPSNTRPVESVVRRGDVLVLSPLSLLSDRCAHSAPAVSRRSRTPAKTPYRSRVIPSVTAPLVPGPICPAPPEANLLPTQPLYTHGEIANVFSTAFAPATFANGVSDARSAKSLKRSFSYDV